MSDQILAELRKIPPVTRFLCGATAGLTLPVTLNLLNGYKLVFLKDLIVKRFEIWRLATTFFFASTNINFIFDMVMLYRMSENLEMQHYVHRSADYAWQLMLACAALLVAEYPLQAFAHFRPMLHCLTTLSAWLAPPGAMTSFFGLITIPIAYLPYIGIAMDLLSGGPRAAAQAIGGVAIGHLWWWTVWGPGLGENRGRGIVTMSGRRSEGGFLERFGRAPTWLKNLMGDGRNTAPGARQGGGEAAGGGVHVVPPRTRLGTPGGGPASATSTGTGYRWGSGQRLGDS